MDETEWLRTGDICAMLRGAAQTRWLAAYHIQFFRAGCCRRFWSLLEDERSRRAVEGLEAYAGGRIMLQELHDIRFDAIDAEATFASRYEELQEEVMRTIPAASILKKQIPILPAISP